MALQSVGVVHLEDTAIFHRLGEKGHNIREVSGIDPLETLNVL